jgi:hypothetical protein
MTTQRMTLTALAIALGLALSAPAFATPVQSNGTREHTNQYHDRTPHVHDHSSTLARR